MEKLLKSMKKEVEHSAEGRNKSSTVHALVILNAGSLKHIDAYRICEALGLRPSFHTEVKKALKTAIIIDNMGFRIVEKV